MQRFKNIKIWFPYVVSMLFIILFIYAASSKLLEFQEFKVQLGQSPMLSAHAGWVALAVPLIEIAIAILLMSRASRRVSLLAAFGLMVMFTTYIIIILNFSSYVPCSCGGVLEKLGWTEHLIFNIGFIVLALIAVLIYTPPKAARLRTPIKKPIGILAGIASFGIGIVAVLFLSSEKIIHERNNFVRRFPKHPVMRDKELDLKFNSYYFSGVDSSHIYLGNVTAPLRLTIVTPDLENKKEIVLTLDYMDYPFRSLRTVIDPPYFYLYDGTVPCLYKGTIGEWTARLLPQPPTTFSRLVPMKKNQFAIRTIIANPRGHTLGVMEYQEDKVVHRKFEQGLPSQGYGIFDADGTLTYSEELDHAVYTFYYRNQFMHYSDQVDSLIFGKTIDTIHQAQIEITKLSNGTVKMSKPPMIVNQYTTTLDHYLLVRSKVMGRFEPEENWDKAGIVDVYDLRDHSYRFSFYIHNVRKDFVREFIGYGNKMYSLTDQYLLSYTIERDRFQ